MIDFIFFIKIRIIKFKKKIVLFSRRDLPESPYWIESKYGKEAAENEKIKIEKLTGYPIEDIPEISKGKTGLRV